MPQMAPISWLNLFFLFIFTFIIFCILNYFNYFISYPNNNSSTINKTQNSFLNWKW